MRRAESALDTPGHGELPYAATEKLAMTLGARLGALLERDLRLTIPTWLAFVFLGIASFVPVVSLRPAWWLLYYAALLACWVLVSVAAKRSMAREDRKGKRKLARVLSQAQSTRSPESAGMAGEAVRRKPAEERLIIVARDDDLHDYIRRGHFGIRRGQYGDETVTIVPDRRSTARRRRVNEHVPERRVAERRCYDIEPVLLARGWAEATLPKRKDSVTEQDR